MPGSSYWNVAIGKDKSEVINDEEGLQIQNVTFRNMRSKVQILLLRPFLQFRARYLAGMVTHGRALAARRATRRPLAMGPNRPTISRFAAPFSA